MILNVAASISRLISIEKTGIAIESNTHSVIKDRFIIFLRMIGVKVIVFGSVRIAKVLKLTEPPFHSTDFRKGKAFPFIVAVQPRKPGRKSARAPLRLPTLSLEVFRPAHGQAVCLESVARWY